MNKKLDRWEDLEEVVPQSQIVAVALKASQTIALGDSWACAECGQINGGFTDVPTGEGDGDVVCDQCQSGWTGPVNEVIRDLITAATSLSETVENYDAEAENWGPSWVCTQCGNCALDGFQRVTYHTLDGDECAVKCLDCNSDYTFETSDALSVIFSNMMSLKKEIANQVDNAATTLQDTGYANTVPGVLSSLNKIRTLLGKLED